MPKNIDENEQALIAVLYEARKLGVDLSKLAEKVSAGIMGNEQYTWVGGSDKTKVLEALKKAIKQTNEV